jgi:Uma2 family endonuclease
MPGAEAEHSAFTVDVLTMLMNALKEADERDCRVFNCLMKFHTPDGCNTYPDISIVRGKADYYRGRNDILTNPILLGEADDRGDKWASYQTLPTLQHFLLLAADRARVELYTREESGWHFEAHEGLEAVVPLPALSVTLTLADLYAQVDFEQAPH